jgi:hypothetical protein
VSPYRRKDQEANGPAAFDVAKGRLEVVSELHKGV